MCIKFFPRYTIESNRPKQKKEIEKDNISIVVFQGKHIEGGHKFYYKIAFKIIPVRIIRNK